MNIKPKYIGDDLERLFEIENIFNKSLKLHKIDLAEYVKWIFEQKELYEHAAVMAHYLEINYGKNYINIGYRDFYWYVLKELQKAYYEHNHKTHAMKTV